MPKVVHFEINADNPERAAEFYSKIFGWKIQKWEGQVEYWLITTGEEEPGIGGGLKRRTNKETTINTIEVSSVDDYLTKIAENGGKILMPKMTIPGVGYHAYCQDTEGNTFGLMQSDPTA